MWQEIFRFELSYRLKRPETYLFFVFLFVVSIFGVDFIMEGIELGLVKKNAPLVIGKTMGALTGVFMILASIIMGMPIIRDDQYQITELLYTNPINKVDLLFGRFLGSFLILTIVFSGIPFGMMLGEFMPWHLREEMLPFKLTTYLNAYSIVSFPTLFFGAALFFVTGFLSRKLLVVYTQGIILFVLFILTKSIADPNLQALLDPFSLTTITQLSHDWSIAEKNFLLLPYSGILLANKMFWTGLGILILAAGFYKFKFTIDKNRKNGKTAKPLKPRKGSLTTNQAIEIPIATKAYDLNARIKQYLHLSLFYFKSMLRETSFWAIVICGVIIILVNSINLGTVYNVASYPTTYLIIEELQEMSLYFFIIILLFYSGELYWKESGANIHPLCDTTPHSSFIQLISKVTGLIGIYVILMMALILSGITFQITKGYYHLDIHLYITGFFIEILPFLIIYTMAAFSIHALVNNKFLGIIITLVFIITTIATAILGNGHILINFGGGGLNIYSEMNGYGHFMLPYLWEKLYWLFVSIGFVIFGSLLSSRGHENRFIQRLKSMNSNFSSRKKYFSFFIFLPIFFVGAHLQIQTNVLNENWSKTEQQEYRAKYEKTLKPFEYIPQPQITSVELDLEIYPDRRSYEINGMYVLTNKCNAPIDEIHIQKAIQSDVSLNSIKFSSPVKIDSQYHKFEYIIYQLERALNPRDSITMHFQQTLIPKGYDLHGGVGSVLDNGTFIRNNEFPTIGYNRKYELQEKRERLNYGLKSRVNKANIDNIHELKNARSSNDANNVFTNITIGTASNQTAITSGNLIGSWKQNERNYFEYQTPEPIINFYALLSGEYEVLKDKWVSETHQSVDLEIYYHYRHTYNLDRMMHGMKASLDYYSANFSTYQYQQLRIVEFPRYEDFAQSFPNTIPFSESIGFMLDINDSSDVDMTFFVTAHEVAHQWWGMQLEAANVKGQHFILETLSQYSAVMVLKENFSKSKVDQFLEDQKERYELGIKKSKIEEAPLYLVENEEHIYYNKGALVMYKLQELIGEENVNLALRSFLQNWNSKNGLQKMKKERFATSNDLIDYLLEASAPNEKDVVLELFN